MKGVLKMHARVEDRIEIESLMKRYCLFFDTKQADDLALLFTVDAVIDYGPEVEPVRGRERLRILSVKVKAISLHQ